MSKCVFVCVHARAHVSVCNYERERERERERGLGHFRAIDLKGTVFIQFFE